MIRFEPVPAPSGFIEIRADGETWRQASPDAKRPKDLWSPFKAHLADGFRNLCGYSAMYEPVGTVDHFVSFHEAPDRAYDWANYRFASAWINSSKSNLRSSDVLDPFEVDDAWFEILLPSLQMVVTDAVPATHRTRAETMLTRLHLGHDERVLRQRREWYRMYQAGELTLDGLKKKAPLIARAIEKQQV